MHRFVHFVATHVPQRAKPVVIQFRLAGFANDCFWQVNSVC